MSAIRVNRTRHTASSAGVLGRLRSTWQRLTSPAEFGEAMIAAMSAEPRGVVEATEGWLIRHRQDGSEEGTKIVFDDDSAHWLGHLAPSHAESLLRAACDLLCNEPDAAISATSVSLPAEAGLSPHKLADMASLMAIEYGVLADASIDGDHVHVRLTRRVPPMPGGAPANQRHNAAPIVKRGQKGRN
ncbi:MAG TPA: hypothetical protein VMT90_06975 [Dehalococcoidia bacterium]|nr:hypothetical protein [Dehalococcoidia bacterium]